MSDATRLQRKALAGTTAGRLKRMSAQMEADLYADLVSVACAEQILAAAAVLLRETVALATRAEVMARKAPKRAAA